MPRPERSRNPPRALALTTAAALACTAAALAAETVMVCPEGSERAGTTDPRRPWVCVLTARPYRDGVRCPPGTSAVSVRNPYDPFKCALDKVAPRVAGGGCPQGTRAVAGDLGAPIECVREGGAGSGFASQPRCPGGTHPVPTPGKLRPFRCEPGPAPKAEPEPSVSPARNAGGRPECPEGSRLRRTENPFEPLQCVPNIPPGPGGPAAKGYADFVARGELRFQYPRSWAVAEQWGDEVPTLFLRPDVRRDGKPVMISIMWYGRGSPGWQDMDSMIWKEKEWHGARDDGPARVAGLPARLLSVPGEGRTVFVELGTGFYVLSYSAPPDAYESFATAFDRVLKTFRVLRKP